MKSAKLTYPLLSVLSAIAMLSYFYLNTQPALKRFYDIPDQVFIAPIPEMLLLSFALLVIMELRIVQSRHRHRLQLTKRLDDQVAELLANKRQLHTKAHVYASHADKLKLFISDKLLEYIEYDEKFLHFKSIASEVRHNGVISYDKIVTALEQQINTLAEDDTQTGRQLRQAQDSLRYLWDLLDLSTADNIALHIANQVCDSEERLFQSELVGDAPPLISAHPVFDAGQALQKALGRCYGCDPVPVASGDGWNQNLMRIPGHDQVRICCQATDKLLGNENHIVLALENVISNAQFFAGRRYGRRSEKRAAISIELDQKAEFIRYHIFNRGDHIDEDAASKLFQLGFSTRRVKEYHGKGLGLYFVNEIIKGYEGVVEFSNISNRADVLSIRLEMANGEVITDVIELIVDGEYPRCRKSGSDAAFERLEWTLSGAVQSIEFTHQNDQQTFQYRCDTQERQHIYDPGPKTFPRWQLDIDRNRKNSMLCFKPLDVTGVQFTVKLPTVTARLEGNLPVVDAIAMDRQVVDISSRFKVPEK